MSIRSQNSKGAIDSSMPPSYFEAALSIFERPVATVTKPFVTPKLQKSISNENLPKKKAPSVQRYTSFLRPLPLLGVLALIVGLLCAGADVIILYKSDGQPVDSWMISPSELIAIISAGANICLQFARCQGVVIAWWRTALHGATLQDLSNYWESGNSLLYAVTPGRGFNLVAFANVFASAVVLDGPILQRASTVQAVSVNSTVNVFAPIAQEIPYGYTAFGDISYPSLVMNQTFAQIVDSYIKRTPMTTNFTGCVGSCLVTVKAAGLAMDCASGSEIWSSSREAKSVFSSTFRWLPSHNGTTAPVYIDVWSWLQYEQYPLINFKLEYAKGRIPQPFFGGGIRGERAVGFCNGTLVRKECALRSATLEYPIRLINNTVTFQGNSSAFVVDHIQDYEMKPPGGRRGDMNPMSYSTLGGIAMAAANMFGSTAVQDFVSLTINGSLASQTANYGFGNSSYFWNQDACSINWIDPSDDILNALNEVMFRTSLGA